MQKIFSPPCLAHSLIILALISLTIPLARAQDSLKLALTGPFSGGSAPMGTSMRDGAKLAINEINAAGGISLNNRKYRIEVIERDDEGKNDRGALVAQELSSMPDLSGVIGTVNTGVAISGDKHFQERGITKIITPAAGSASMSQWSKADVQDLSIFRFAAHDGIQAAMVVEEAIKRNFTKVALLHDSSNYGVSGREDLLEQIKLQGNKLEVVATEKFNVGDKDMTAQLLRTRVSGAQAILIWGVGPELAAIANGMAKNNIRLPLIGGWALSMSNFIDNAGKNSNGAMMPQTFIEEATAPRVKNFIANYYKTYSVSRIPSPVSAAQGYDAVLLFIAAIKQAQSSDTRKIKLALENLREPVPGVIANWKQPFGTWNASNPQSHEAFRREHVVMGMVRDGRVIFAYEADRARLVKNLK